MRFSFLIISLLFLTNFLYSQKSPIRFGKISKAEKDILKTDLDPNANAIILCDYGEINFLGNSVEITRHTRIKILNQNGLDEANIVLPYIYKDNRERIFKVKAHTINVNSKGKLKKTKVNKDQIYTVDLSDIWKEKRFTFPNVQPGSIIEFQYSKTTENVVSLEEWSFQNELPTLKSQLNVIVGDNLDYRIVYNGNRLINTYGNKSTNSWSLENLPPIKDESFCPNPNDYVETIRFQLAGYKRYSSLPGGGSEYVELMTTWENLAKKLLDLKDYQKILNRKKESNKLIYQIINEGDNDLEKVRKVYSFIQNNIDWNGQYRLFPEETFSTIMEKKSGSSAEINLCLVRLLQSADLDANPLIISTKENGLVTKIYPLYNQFNHILAQVKIGEKDILMDAINKYRPYNLLDKNDLKPSGFLLNKDESRWVKIDLPKKTKTVIVNNLMIENKKLKFKIAYAFFEHEAANYRQKFHEENGMESFITTYLHNEFNGEEMALDSFSVKHLNNLEKPFSVTCHYSKPFEDELESDIIYLNPFLKKHLDKNPFVNPIRYLPVDFFLPSSERFLFNLYIPEGFELAEIPRNVKYSTDSKKISYSYSFSKIGNRNIQLSSNFKIKEPIIYPNEYGALRELFNVMMGVQSTQLVLRRK